MNTFILKIFFLVLLFFISCQRKSETIDSITKTEYEIYSVVIDSLFTNNNNNSLIIIPDSTDRNRLLLHVRIKKNGKWVESNDLNRLNNKDSIWYKSDYKELTMDYNAKNKKQYPINNKFIKCSINLKQLSTDSLNTIFSSAKDGWEMFYKIFPNSLGTIIFSRIGFNLNENQAVFYISHNQGSLNGVGLYILLHKYNSQWKIKNITRAWVS